jgi:hypothetical protein
MSKQGDGSITITLCHKSQQACCFCGILFILFTGIHFSRIGLVFRMYHLQMSLELGLLTSRLWNLHTILLKARFPFTLDVNRLFPVQQFIKWVFWVRQEKATGETVGGTGTTRNRLLLFYGSSCFLKQSLYDREFERQHLSGNASLNAGTGDGKRLRSTPFSAEHKNERFSIETPLLSATHHLCWF